VFSTRLKIIAFLAAWVKEHLQTKNIIKVRRKGGSLVSINQYFSAVDCFVQHLASYKISHPIDIVTNID
jgi:hypothetical protein